MLLEGYIMQLNVFTITLLLAFSLIFELHSSRPTTGSKCILAYMLLTCRGAAGQRGRGKLISIHRRHAESLKLKLLSHQIKIGLTRRL